MDEKYMKLIYQAQNGNKEAMAEIIEKNQGLVWSIVKRKAIKKFDTSFDVMLSTYAVPYILGEIKRFIRDDGIVKVSRSIKELGAKVREVQNEYIKKNGKDIKVEEIAQILKVSKEEIACALEAARPVDSIYDTTYQNDEEGLSLIDKISSNINETNRLIDKISISDLIEKLSDKEKQLIILRYYKGKTQSEVAKILGITQVQVSRTEKKILSSMRLKLAM